MMEIVLATRNQGKVAEMRALLQQLPVKTLSLSSFRDMPSVVEDEATLEGNAIKKAREISNLLSMPVISDDTGLEVRSLDGRPGVYSARYAGPAEDPAANRALLLSELNNKPDRFARFRTVIAFVNAEATHLFDGTCDGRIATAERGEGGFGYDSLFIPEGLDRTFAELSPSEKNAISHRGRALAKLVAFLNDSITVKSK